MKRALVAGVILTALAPMAVGTGGPLAGSSKPIAGVICSAIAAANRWAGQQGAHEGEFRAFYADFLKAVQANDKEKIADMVAYPVSSWSVGMKKDLHEVSIKDKADFLARFNELFTNYMRLHLPKAKVQSTPELWFTSWKDAYTEYLFQFKYIEGAGFKITTYDVGAA